MSIPSRLFRTARPGCDVKGSSLRLVHKQTSRPLTYFRRVPGLSEQTPLRDTSEAQSLRTAQTSTLRQTQSRSEDTRTSSTKDYFVYQHGRKHDFYEYFLQKRKISKPPILSPWILSLDPHPKSLPTELDQNLLRIFDDTGADLNLVKLCLQTFVARAHRDHGNGPEARELYKSTKIGSRALLWFLDHAFETVDIALDVTWPELLAHCLVAEDDTHKLLHHWLTMNQTPEYAAVWDARECNRWRSTIFRLAIDSMVFWANEISAGINVGLKFFNHITKNPSETNRIPIFGAGTTMDSYLSNFDTSKVDVSELKQFMRMMMLWAPPGTMRHSWVTARLMLNYPSGPRPAAALDLFLDVDANRADFFKTGDGPFNASIMSAMVRTAQGLHSMGRKRDARRILSIGRNRLPTYFKVCKVTDTNRDKLNGQAVIRVLDMRYSETTGRSRLIEDHTHAQRAIRSEMLRNR
ncbi:hypothetical protein CB0940_10653 [Cercospora beticola]|uniref:Uncharacterized protein n=1 Tax=Cercospora beticola TaxID=122368 RepID=A0A2G5HTC7_CERBT|nr:hypothetical protein CB0940_10653 [Cercospora beticola]PIA95778.1 hypothetical protein CB0940_10653 [Cercospora beticola]WPB07381.1 hypothetical protein RHO25_012042 [Cercospora beticola]